MIVLLMMLQISIAPVRQIEGHKPSWREVLFYGDSKFWLDTCQTPFIKAVNVTRPSVFVTRDVSVPSIGIPGTLARVGGTVTSMLSTLTADLAAIPTEARPSVILFNLGINEVIGGLPAEATWKANALTVLDALRARWPSAPVYLMRVWRQGAQYQASIGTINGWIEWLPTQRTWISLGPDERVWAENGDDGATMFYDGLHYSTAGGIECGNQWKTALGW